MDIRQTEVKTVFSYLFILASPSTACPSKDKSYVFIMISCIIKYPSGEKLPYGIQQDSGKQVMG